MKGRMMRGRVRALCGRATLCGVLMAGLLSRDALADPKDDARRHFVAGLEAAARQDYQTALQEFLEAQASWPHPATAFNIARSYADLQNYPEAVSWYRRYQEMAPDKADSVEPAIAALEARMRPAAPVQRDPTPSAPAAVASATPAELERLRDIAAELEALSRSLATRAPEAPPTGAEGPSAAPTPSDADPSPGEAPAESSAALLSEAYERVVITASRYGQEPLDSPSTVSVITEEDIRLSGATNIPDLLRRVVGVDVMSLSASQPDLSIRGFNRELSNKVLVLIDGRSVYLDVLGAVIWSHLPISLAEIERIEIIRGPGSAVYGANAVTGVINIITRTPGQGRNVAMAEAGNPGYLQGNAVVTGGREQTTWRVSAGLQQAGRWSQHVDAASYGSLDTFLEDQDSALSVIRTNGRVDQTFLDKGFFSLSGGYATGVTEFYTLGALGDYVFDMNNGYGRADLSYGPFHLRAFYNAVSGENGPWSQYVGARDLNNVLDTDVLDVEAETQQDFTTGQVEHRLAAGVGYRYKRVTWDYLATQDNAEGLVDEHHLNAFAQDEARIGPVSLVASLRVDRHPLVPDITRTLSPRGAAIVRVADKTSVRVSGGTSFRAPSFLESYLDLELPVRSDATYVRVYGDTALEPERIATAEIGVHDESTAFHMADATLFVNRVSKLIGLGSIEPVIVPFDTDESAYLIGIDSFQNLTPTYLGYGAELDARLFPVDGLDVYANLALQQIRDDEAELEQSSSFAKLNVGALYRSPWRLDLAAHVHTLSRQVWQERAFNEAGELVVTPKEIPARTIASVRLGARPLGDDRLEVAVTAWNLLALAAGEGAQEHPSGQEVGGRLFGTAIWRF